MNDNGMNRNRSGFESEKWVTLSDDFPALVRRARSLVRNEGLRGLLSGFGRYVGTLMRLVYRNEHLCLYELRVDEAGPIPLSPPFEGVEAHVIETRDDAHRLMVQGYEDVILNNPQNRRRLHSGSVAVCAFVDREFASIDWMAFSECAKRSFDKLPYEVEFEKGEAYTGGAFTVRRFRRRGIATYRFSHELCYMRNHGCCVCRNAIGVGNIPSQRPVERFGGCFSKVGHIRRFLWRTRWTETPVA